MLDLSHLNLNQQKAVTHQSGPAIVLAGAGSGKTTVLTHHALWLLTEDKVQPDSMMIVTFTNKAAQEIRSRIEKSPGLIHPPYVGTFHSFCAKLLRQYGRAIELDPYFTIYDSDDQKALLKAIIKDLNYKGEISVNAAKGVISKAKNELISAKQYSKIARGAFQEKLSQIYRNYQQRLQKAQAVDFDDLLALSVKLIDNNQAVREKLQQQFSHILIDEYQDTNVPQYLLSIKLAAPHDNLFVVGDFAQSIYSWRGADYKNMLKLYKQYQNLTEYKLEQNYRSSQNILDAATSVISQNTSHPILELWTEQTSQQKIELIDTQNANEEAKIIIERLIASHRAGVQYQQMAVLYRTNAQSRQFEEALLRAKIPYEIVGGVGFYERKEVKDILCYVRLIINPTDEVARQRAEKLGKRRLATFDKWIKNQDFKQLKPIEIIQELIEVTAYLDRYQKDDPADQARIENIYELEAVAMQFDSLVDFLENVALVQNSTLLEGRQKNTNLGVQLMSLHAAKGLEFELVCVTGLEEGLLPHSSALMNHQEMEEERRLCYVGITRAKKQLILSFSRSRFLRGSYINSFPSRFISDIPTHLLKTSSKLITNQTQNRKFVPDDDMLEKILDDDLDVDALIEW